MHADANAVVDIEGARSVLRDYLSTLSRADDSNPGAYWAGEQARDPLLDDAANASGLRTRMQPPTETGISDGSETVVIPVEAQLDARDGVQDMQVHYRLQKNGSGDWKIVSAG